MRSPRKGLFWLWLAVACFMVSAYYAHKLYHDDAPPCPPQNLRVVP